jgi:hypothetical protein
MQNNICKFIIPSYPEPLTVSLYVKETDLAAMKTPYPLSQYRIILIMQGEGTFAFSEYKETFKKGLG